MQIPILPVLDLMDGQIVRGVAGRRHEYRPIVSTLAASAEPMTIARAFRAQFGFDEFYLADLDAIRRRLPDTGKYDELVQGGFRLWIDAGIQQSDDAILDWFKPLAGCNVVVGLESIAGPEELRRVALRVGVDKTVFSLDRKNGQLLGRLDLWSGREPLDLLQHSIEVLGIRRIIVLDLADVGVSAGVSSEDLCIQAKRHWPDVQLTTGGGVRGIDDVKRLVDLGVDRVLVASALHDGRITRDML